MRIVWISDTAPAGFTTDAGYFEHHRQASLRFRVGVPARALATLGVESGFIGLDTPAVLEHLAPERVDTVVFSKLSTPRGPTYDAFVTAYLGTADHARERGLGVIVDLVDNVFAADRRDFFVQLLARVDAVTVPTAMLAEVCAQHSEVPVHVVADPVEGERRAPEFEPPRPPLLSRIGLGRALSRPLRLLWFGGQYRNFLDLAALFPALSKLASALPIDLVVIMSRDDRIAHTLDSLHGDRSSGLAARFVEWSLASLAGALEHCDIVLLPANLQDGMRTVASPNRLARALWAGRAVVAHPLPSYTEFRDAALLSDDPVDAIRRALAHPDSIVERIASGQRIIASQYSSEAVGRRWHEVLALVSER